MSGGSEVIFEPDELKYLGAAFDEAWTMVSPSFREADAERLAQARMKLASIMIELAKLPLGHEEMKRQAIPMFHQACSAGE
jgi:hypothetical protein